MRFLITLLLVSVATVHAQEPDQRKRLIFSTTRPEPDPSPAAAPAAHASPTAAASEKHPEPAAVIENFFLALKAGQVDAAYDGLVKDTIIAERKENVTDLKTSTKKALDHYGPVAGYEVTDTLAVGSSLLRQTCISLNQDLPLRWRFYFYKAGAEWKIVDMRVDDGLVELFEEAGAKQKK